ncbi:hypothetical protein SAMN04487948_12149 [Halogranum amylolyticum]|uniref:DUF2795 domain-containing protein n=1 Tax=Halogranum amylolyticum TaxID=660520 RepID=A0A1H8VZ75_9EURY|nr:hypothetical protein [Halogranum amylolyticum]SEP20699.1 hypothetical protein SAMN04487948_12149 [Halogranum amylolyticum]
MTDSDSDDREHGVDFGDLDDELDSHDYPASKDDLVAEYGDRELDFPKGEMTFEEALEGYKPTDGEFQDADDVRSAVKNMVDAEAVGREGYSDRGVESETTDETDTNESV